MDSMRLAIASVEENQISAGMDTLRSTLHEAMRLEASTVPPYYVAAWSIQDADGYQNKKIRDLVAGVSKEEMMHMMAIANISAATGNPPNIATPEIVLDWGTEPLPIGTDLVPTLAPFSMEILTNLFMEIEKPENPTHYVVVEPEMAMKRESDKEYATIGEFYEALIDLINAFPDDPFLNGADYPQININDDFRFANMDYAPIENFVVSNREHAIELIHWIVDQGEGTSTNPMDGNGLPAHYYRFAEIFKGGELIESPVDPLGYVYDKANHPINCDFTKIFQFEPNPKMADWPEDSRQYKGLLKFNTDYTNMFKYLQAYYDDGDQSQVTSAINVMNSMAGYVMPLLTSDPPVCPSFEWVD